MSKLSYHFVENMVDKYLIAQFAMQKIMDSCDDLIMQHNVKSFIPYKTFYDTLHLTKNLVLALYQPTPYLDLDQEDIEPTITIKDNYQSAIKIDLIFPDIQEEFLTSLTKFNKNSSLKSSMKSSVRSFRKTQISKQQEKQQTTQQGQLHLNFSPCPLQMNEDQYANEQDQFYREAFEMKKKQQQIIKLNKIAQDQQKQQIKQQLLDLKKKHIKSNLTYDNDGSILVQNEKIKEYQYQINPEIKVFANQKDKQQVVKQQIQVGNIISNQIQKQKNNIKINNSCEARMKTEPVRVANQSFIQQNLDHLSQKEKVRKLLYDSSMQMTKQQFQSMIGCENDIGEILHQKILRYTQLQLQRTSYIQQYHQSKSITPLANEDSKGIEKSISSPKKQGGKIKLANLAFIEQFEEEDEEANYKKANIIMQSAQSQKLRMINTNSKTKNIQFKLTDNALPTLTVKPSQFQVIDSKKNQIIKKRSQTTYK